MSVFCTDYFNSLTQLKNRIEGKLYYDEQPRKIFERAVELGYISKIALAEDTYMYMYSQRMNGRTIHCFKNKDTRKSIQFSIE